MSSPHSLRVGDTAPDFDVVASNGTRLSLRELKGKKNVVIYFYPKDFTLVCTRETCGFRDMYGELRDADTEVIGVSFDDNETHEKFAKEYKVPFPLVADTNKDLAKAFGALSFFRNIIGRASRVTYLIDKTGTVAGVYKAELSANAHLDGVKKGLEGLK
ncbi:peroxiredoxin [soil metagenome]